MLAFDDDVLLCPFCGNVNLHQDRVVSMFRDAEDCAGNMVTCVPMKTNIDRLDDSQLPGRRDTVDIFFWCECCPKKFAIRFQQHKGSTLVSVIDAYESKP